MTASVFTQRIHQLRALMKSAQIESYLIVREDAFIGEYVRPYDERLAWISGFTGSAGFAIITQKQAWLFVDSRYSLQAQTQAPDFEIKDMLNDEWKNEALGILGYDPDCVSVERAQSLPNAQPMPNLIDKIWTDKPQAQDFEIQPLSAEFTGASTEEKLKALRARFDALNIDGFLTNSPENLAWLLNIRGGEIPTVPAPHGFMLVTKAEIRLYGLPNNFSNHFASLRSLSMLKTDLSALSQSIIGYDSSRLTQSLFEMIPQAQAVQDPIAALKAIKSEAEIRAAYEAHQRDGQAMIGFLSWLSHIPLGQYDEIDAEEQLWQFRQNQGAVTPSFETISAFGAHGAIVHYRAKKPSQSRLEEGVYLLDSGAHYQGATTDITRTIWLSDKTSKPNSSIKAAYTAVLQGLADISQVIFPEGTKGQQIEAFARRALWKLGKNYGHGTGHGVGAQLSVHEGPQSLSPRSEIPLEAGMILSLEPGFYEEGEYGIRLENLAVIRPHSAGFLQFETLSYVPFDKNMINQDALDDSARRWLDDYHIECQKRHAPSLSPDERAWLDANCQK